jgi:peptidoglycan hydrolase-like protein with peptidoglycan-binding domain
MLSAMNEQLGKSRRRTVTRRLTAVMVCAVVVLAACSSDSKAKSDPVAAAQADVDAAKTALTDAQNGVNSANTKFCTETQDYIQAIDRYGKLFEQNAATVGDVKTVGADLVAPRDSVETAAKSVGDARAAVTTAEKQLADAEAALAAAAESASTALPPTSPSTTSTTTTLPPSTIDRVKVAEQDLQDAAGSITDQTKLTEATVEYNSAAFALEVAWLQLFSQAGCLADDQAVAAVKAVQDYTVALQNDLTAAGYYSGKVDGIYGPATVDAVKKLQTDKGLPVTGLVDQATGVALDAAVKAKGRTTETAVLTQVAAIQTTLKLAGYWTGPIDGIWSPELTQALKDFQTALGVPATGAVDAATLAALEQTIADLKAAGNTTTTTESSSSSSDTTTTTAAN